VSNLVFHSEERIAIISEQCEGKCFGPKGQEVTGLWKIDPSSLSDEFTQRKSLAQSSGNYILVNEG
jgi:hypothetical protein